MAAFSISLAAGAANRHPASLFRDIRKLDKALCLTNLGDVSLYGLHRGKNNGNWPLGRIRGREPCRATIARRRCRPSNDRPNNVRVFHAKLNYQPATWDNPHRVVARVEWHPGELHPCVGFIVINLSRPTTRVVAFYSQRGTVKQ
jgi:hypothetical protein